MFGDLTNLGLPEWVLIIAGLAWILKTFGLLDPIQNAFSAVFSFIKDRVQTKEKHQQKQLTDKQKAQSIDKLKESYLESWLPEQFTTNQAETLAQLGAYQDFLMKEVSQKLDISNQLAQKIGELKTGQEGIRANQEHFSIRLSEIWENFDRIFQELDLVNRHLDDIDRNILEKK